MKTFKFEHTGTPDAVGGAINTAAKTIPADMRGVKAPLLKLLYDVLGAKDEGAASVKATLWIDDRSGMRNLHSKVTNLSV